MKKAVSIFAVLVMTMGLFSCDKTSANNDDLYETVDTSANDDNSAGSSGGSGGN
ncbi:MAG: hypothetical protein ACR2MT_05500 [Aurantibacter sp.]